MDIFISGITSDIGKYVCQKYMGSGHTVSGTYRKRPDEETETRVLKRGGKLLYCDFKDKKSIDEVVRKFARCGLKWDVFISAVGVMSPVKKFEEAPIDLWEENIYVNTVSQMRLLRGLLPYRQENACVYFMTSKGINDTFPLHSAYCISKILLVKMCELLDDEIEDCKFIAFNPGFIRTKIIDQEPEPYISTGINVEDDTYNQSEMEKVWKFIVWSSGIDKKIISGRNYFVKYDDWESKEFLGFLQEDSGTYKLRRNRDDWRK